MAARLGSMASLPFSSFSLTHTVCVCVRERESVCVSERERVCVYVRAREGEREGEKKRESVCVSA